MKAVTETCQSDPLPAEVSLEGISVVHCHNPHSYRRTKRVIGYFLGKHLKFKYFQNCFVLFYPEIYWPNICIILLYLTLLKSRA
jgi:hypothetical protein